MEVSGGSSVFRDEFGCSSVVRSRDVRRTESEVQRSSLRWRRFPEGTGKVYFIVESQREGGYREH